MFHAARKKSKLQARSEGLSTTMHSHSDKQNNNIMATVRDALRKERKGAKTHPDQERRTPE